MKRENQIDSPLKKNYFKINFFLKEIKKQKQKQKKILIFSRI